MSEPATTRRTKRGGSSRSGPKGVQTLLRLPPAVRECVESSARNGYRSINAEVVRILELYFADSHGVIVQPQATRPQVKDAGGVRDA